MLWTRCNITCAFGHEWKNLLVIFIYFVIINDTENMLNNCGQPRPILHARIARIRTA